MYRGPKTFKRPLLVAHGGISSAFDTQMIDQQHSISPLSDQDTPRSKGRAKLLPARFVNGFLMFASIMLALACYLIISKHRQYETAHRQLESLYQVRPADRTALEHRRHNVAPIKAALERIPAIVCVSTMALVLQAKLKAEIAAIEALNDEQRQLKVREIEVLAAWLEEMITQDSVK